MSFRVNQNLISRTGFQDLVAEALYNMVVTKAARNQKALSISRTGYAHGPGGLLSQPGVEPDIFNAMQLPRNGLAASLPERATNKERPLYAIITGQTPGPSTTPITSKCDTWGVAGLLKLCRQDAILGTKGIASDPLDMRDMGRRTDRSDMDDFYLVGNPQDKTNVSNAISTIPGGQRVGNFLLNELEKALIEAEFESIRRWAPAIYTDNPSNTPTAYDREYMRGLATLVNDNYKDAITGDLCPKANSLVLDFSQISPFGTNISTNADAMNLLVDLFAEIFYVLKRMATETGLEPATWDVSMTPEMFRGLTAGWACSYQTNRCQFSQNALNGANATLYVNANDAGEMREDMRKGSFLWVDAMEQPVIQDSAIPWTQPTPGVFQSDIWITCRLVRSNIQSHFKTFFDFNGPNAMGDVLAKLGDLAFGFDVSQDGRFAYALTKEGYCFQTQTTYRPGQVLRAPYLSVRLKGLQTQPRLAVPNWNPGVFGGTAPSFYLNGGVTTGQAPSYYGF